MITQMIVVTAKDYRRLFNVSRNTACMWYLQDKAKYKTERLTLAHLAKEYGYEIDTIHALYCTKLHKIAQ